MKSVAHLPWKAFTYTRSVHSPAQALGDCPQVAGSCRLCSCAGAGGGRGRVLPQAQSPGWPWKPGVPAQPPSLPSDSPLLPPPSYGRMDAPDRGLAPGAGSLSKTAAPVVPGPRCQRAVWAVMAEHVQRLAPHDPLVRELERAGQGWGQSELPSTLELRGFHARAAP